MSTNRPDDLTGVLQGTPGPDFAMYQGLVTAWNAGTGENTVQLAGGLELTDVPLMSTADAAFISTDTIVSLVRWKSRYFIAGVISIPPNLPDVGGGGGAAELSDLSDVDTSGAADGDILVYDGGVWTPEAPSGFTVGHGFVATQQGTTSSTFTALAGGPSATVTIGPSGQALVTITAKIDVEAGEAAEVGVAISGATTRSTNADRTLTANRLDDFDSHILGASATYVHTGLNQGSTTFTMMYRRISGDSSALFSDRQIVVIPV